MKKLIVVLLAVSMLVLGGSVADAKKLKDVTNEDASSFVRDTIVGAGAAIGQAGYYSVKYVLKGLAVPFYWLEKVKK